MARVGETKDGDARGVHDRSRGGAVREKEAAKFLFLSDETLAEAIAKISAAVHHLSHSGLNRKAIIVLIADDTKLPKTTIAMVLESLAELRTKYGSK